MQIGYWNNRSNFRPAIMSEIRANNRFNILTELRARPPLTTVRYHISSESCFYSDEMEMSVGAMHIQRKLNRGR